METIFDHAPTKEELRYLAGNCSPDQYRQEVTADEALTDLCQLFAMRGDGARSRSYADRISDRAFVNFSLQNGDFIPFSAASNRGADAQSMSKAA